MLRTVPHISAILITTKESSTRRSALVHVTPTSVVAEGDSGACSLPLKGLQISWGGANNTLLFLSHPHYPEVTLFTRDRTIISMLEEHMTPDLYQQLRALKAASSRRTSALLTIIALVFSAVWGLTFLWSPATQLVASTIPFSWEQRVGKLLFGGLATEMTFIDDEELSQRLLLVTQPLLEQVKAKGYPIEFHVAKNDDLNAFAISGGIVVINSGTILKASRPEELLGVVAHEISHVTERHTLRQVITVFGVYVVVDFLLGDLFGSVAALSQGASYLLQQGFSREQEHDADIRALAYLEAARINPLGMVEFFERIRDQRNQHAPLATLEKSLSFLSTHPDTDSRITDLQERIRQSAHGPPLPLAPFQDLQRRLEERLREKQATPS